MTKRAKKIISKKKSVRSGNAQRLITTTRRQEKGKKRNLTFISFKEKKHTNLLLKTHIEAVLSKFTLLYCVLDLSPAIRANSSQPLFVLGGRVHSRSPTSASEADQLRGKPEASLYQAH